MPVVFNDQTYIKNVETELGTIGFIEINRQNKPSNLKHPYEYVLSIKKTKQLVDYFKKYFKKFEGICQCAGITTKSISKGIRLNIFVLGHDNIGYEEKGVSKEQWVELCNHIQDKLNEYLGPDANIYAEAHHGVTGNLDQQPAQRNKFQARFDTYIAYKELL